SSRDIDQEVVPIRVDLEIVGCDFADAVDGFVHVKPGSGLDLDRGIAQFRSLLRFDGVIFGRHVMRPEGERTPVAYGVAQQVAHRHTGQLARGVKQGHLQARAQAVVPHEAEGRLADDTICILDAPPGVALNRLAPADNARVGFNADEFDDAPVVQTGALHFAAYPFDQGNDEQDAFYIGDFGRGQGAG